MSDFLTGVQPISGTGAATATATLAASNTQRGYLIAAAVEVTAGTATLCRLELRSGASVIYAVTFPVQAAAAATGGQIVFPALLPISAIAAALNVVATTTGATTTNVRALVAYGP